MKKTEQNIYKILDFLALHGAQSSTQIGKYLGMTSVSAFLNLRAMLEKGMIEKEGKGKNTRYRLTDNLTDEQKAVLVAVIDILRESGFDDPDITTQSGLRHMLTAYFVFVSPEGRMLVGIEGFIAWCRDAKRGYTEPSIYVRELVYWVTKYYEYEVLRRKHGFFDGTLSLEKVLLPYTSLFIDTLLFYDIVEVSGFGKTRTAWELYLGKQNSDRALLERGISESVLDVQQYLKKKKIDALVFTPPTIPRKVQFRDILRNMIKIELPEIQVEKNIQPQKILLAQKTLKGADRIINARESVVILQNNILLYNHICILDDNFTTGATMNAIAEKLRGYGFMGTITAITITGKFHSQVFSDDAEI
jgi:DNA-binding MarR family transcriptional regulator